MALVITLVSDPKVIAASLTVWAAYVQRSAAKLAARPA